MITSLVSVRRNVIIQSMEPFVPTIWIQLTGTVHNLFCYKAFHNLCQSYVCSKPEMTYHTQGESQHTIFRTLFAISNDVQHPKLAIQWRILIKSALSRDVWLKIAPYPGMGKGFFVTDIVSNNPPGFHVIFRHAYLGRRDVAYRFAIIRCLFMQDYSSNTIARKPNLLSPVCN